MPKIEHILLESDAQQVPDPRDARRVHARIEFRSRLHRCVLQLEIIDYYYLSVRSHPRSGPLEYVVDLRFVDAPRRFRHIAWRWIGCSLIMMALGSATPWPQHDWLAVYIAAAIVWALATLAAVYRTTETVYLFSSHGAARLLECSGGLGTLRAVQGFMTKLAAHIRLASGARRPTKAEHLRDEMREHLRLREIGVLSAAQYEAAKARILDQHSPTAHRPRPSEASGRLETCHPNATVSRT